MYLALYRKWRPQNFDDVISQPHITTTLTNEIKHNHVAHAYLFTGSRGTGKTTCSKILAKAVNCLHPVDGQPCLKCEICKGIEDGSILDVVEIDAASNNGVDNIRELRDEANFTPVSCKYRVYIIDEAHMLSIGAFNALLKIMEEPPAHVIFILATTEAHKIPVTILSRCQRFDFRRIKTDDIVQRLLKISTQEDFSLTPDAAGMIARLADGGMRDALSLLDQCIAYSSEITADVVASAAGVAGREYLFEFHQAIMEQDTARAMTLLDELYSKSKDLERLCEELIHFYRNLMMVKVGSGDQQMLSVSDEELHQFQHEAEPLKLSQIIHCLTVLQDTMDRLGRVSNKRLELEICFVKLSSPKYDYQLDSINRRLDQLESKLKYGIAAAPVESEKMDSSIKEEQKNQLEQPTHTKPVEQSETSTNTEPKLKQRPEPLECWNEIVQEIGESSGLLFGILRGSYAMTSGDRLLIQSPNAVFKETVQSKKELMDEIIFRYTGRKYRILIKGTKTQETEENPLDDVLDRARASGIPVIEE